MNSLAVYEKFDGIQKAASAMQKSGYFKDVVSEAQAIVKVMAGAELGLPPFASMSGIHIIQGKPVLGANVIATLIKNSGRYDYQVRKCDATECVLAFHENGKLSGEVSFTMAEAKAAGLTGKDNWAKFPSDMLFARAISRGARRFAPGIFGGSPVYTPDEMGADVDEDGHVITVTAAPVDEQPAVNVPEMSMEQASLEHNRENVPYVDLDTPTLAYMINSMTESIKKNGLTPDKHAEYQRKIAAAKVIVASRK